MCDEFLNNVYLYIDNMLDDEKRKKFEEHVNSCESCKKDYEEIKSIVADLNNIEDINIPDNLHENIMKEINNIYEEEQKKKDKIIKIDFYKKTLYTVASVIGFSLVLTPIISGITYDVKKTTVMAEDLNLVDHIRLFGKENYVDDKIAVSIKSDNITSTLEELEKTVSDYGDVTSVVNLDDVATLEVSVSKENAPLVLSSIIDRYDDVVYSADKSVLNKEIKEIDKKLKNGSSSSSDIQILSLLNEKSSLLKKCSSVNIYITIHS